MKHQHCTPPRSASGAGQIRTGSEAARFAGRPRKASFRPFWPRATVHAAFPFGCGPFFAVGRFL